MPKNIIIAGAGVGGLIVGAKLSLKGYDVSLFSIGSADSLGYDWTDSMDVFTLEKIIGKKLPKTDYLYDDIVAFYAPSKKDRNFKRGRRQKNHNKDGTQGL